MPDTQALEMQLIKTLYSKYQQETITIDGVFLKAQFNGLSDLINVELKGKPFNTKMLIADVQFVIKSLEISNNVNENKVQKMVLAKLQQFPKLLDGINDFVQDNQLMNEQLDSYLQQLETVEQTGQEIKANKIYRKIGFMYYNEDEDSQKVIEDFKVLQLELLKKITQSNKAFLLKISKQISNIEPKEAVIKILLSKVCTNPQGSLLLLKVFKA
ncbi:MAG: hypothetical protein WCH76_01765 [Candidatus Riflemargulisbacteria bacterium]